MTSHFIAGAYSVKIANLETGAVVDLPSVSTYKPPTDSPADERVYRLADMETTITIELSPEDGERLLWIMIRAWFWQRYRISYN